MQNIYSTNYLFLKKTLGGFLFRCVCKQQKVDVVHAVIKYSESEEANPVIMKVKDSCRNVQSENCNTKILHTRIRNRYTFRVFIALHEYLTNKKKCGKAPLIIKKEKNTFNFLLQ